MSRNAVVALFKLIIILILSHYKVKGCVIIGISPPTILALPLVVTNINILLGKTEGITCAFFDSFKNFFSMKPNDGVILFFCFTEGVIFPKGSLVTTVMLVITFLMIDMFDTMGTVVGCCSNAKLIDDEGKPLNYGKIMNSDSITTIAGSLLGTSTVTTFVESGAGIAEGGKTGLTALVVAILFILSIFFLPIFAFKPSAAAASALIYVGVLMMSNIKNIDFNNIKFAVPAFLTIIMMPLTYSITNGIGIGVISYFIINIIIYIIDKIRDKKNTELNISIVTFIITLLFLVYFLVPTIM